MILQLLIVLLALYAGARYGSLTLGAVAGACQRDSSHAGRSAHHLGDLLISIYLTFLIIVRTEEHNREILSQS